MAQNLLNRQELDTFYPKLPSASGLKTYYSQFKQTLQTGDLIFYSGNHWLSGLIRWRSKSAWSHVGMVIRVDEIGHIFIIESVVEKNGVRLIPVSSIYRDYGGDNKPYNGRVVWARYLNLTDEQKNEMRASSLELLNKQYDSKEFLRVAWRSFTGRQKLFPDNKFTCAELIHHCFQKARIRLNYDRGLFISPGSIWRDKNVEMMGVLL